MSEPVAPLSPRAKYVTDKVTRRYLEALNVQTADSIQYADITGGLGYLFVNPVTLASATRSFTEVSGRTKITNPAGIAGNTVIDISDSYVGQATITTLGTVVTGTWNAGLIESVYLANTAVANLSGVNTGDQASVTGNAGSATTIATTATATNAAHYIAFFSSSTNGNQVARLDADLTYNPSTNTFTASNFVGALTGNVTGNASTATLASTVTTNANLTGPITSSGNATAVASQTGSGSKFVMDTSPTLVTPHLGTPTDGTLTNCTGYTDAHLSVSDITTNNASTSAHGFLKKLSNTATEFMNGQGNWATPAGAGTVTSVATAGLATGGTITGSGTVTVTAAVQSDMETSTSTTTAVTPGVVQYHPGVAKVWAFYTGVGTPSILASYNASSITDNATGIQTINFTTSFSSASFCAVACAKWASGVEGRLAGINARATGSVKVNTIADAGPSDADATDVYVACFGDQ